MAQDIDDLRYGSVIVGDDFRCGDCGYFMKPDFGYGEKPTTIRCRISTCRRYNVRYKVPRVPVERVEDAVPVQMELDPLAGWKIA